MTDSTIPHRRVLRAVLAPLLLLIALLGLATPALAAPLPAADPAAESAAGSVEVVVYRGEGCARCEALLSWLDEISADHPTLRVTTYEVWDDADNRARFVAAGEELGFEASAVPTTVLDRRVWIGFTDPISRDIADAIALAEAGDPVPPGVYGTPGAGTCDEQSLECAPGEEPGLVIDVPWVGEVDLGGRSLLVSTVIIGFVDGVNPCSLWVISVLLTIVVRAADRRRVVAIGSTFLVVTASMYALYMVGIYSALTVVGWLGAIQWVVAAFAAVFGAVSVKDYFAFKKGISFTISDSAKPGIYQRMRAATAHRSLLPALGATAALAVAVSLLETPCTAGFPVLWTGMLQANGVGPVEASLLFVAYMIPFLLDELLVFGIAVVTMRATKMQEKHGQLLKLFSGVTMLALAAVMVANPALMENPLAALGLFAAAFALAAVVHAVTERVRAGRAARGVTAGEASAVDAPAVDAPAESPAGSDAP